MSEQARRQKLLLTAIAKPECLADLTSAELDLLLRHARRARVLGYIAEALQRSETAVELPTQVADILEGARVSAEARSRVILWELDRVAQTLGAELASQVVVLKGAAYALLEAPNARGRIVADIDLLAEKALLPEVEARLAEGGWSAKELSDYDQRYYREWTHEIPPLVHRERDVEVDVHFNILPQSARLKPRARDLFDQALPSERSAFRVLAPADLVLHAMAHLMFDADLADDLRDLLDIALLLEHFAARDANFWQQLVQRAETLDLGRPAYYGVHFASRLFAVSVPGDAREALRRWQPGALASRCMDTLVPFGLLPPDPDSHDRRAELARTLLFIRSHWIRMPPWMLAYHSLYKMGLSVRGRLTAAEQ